MSGPSPGIWILLMLSAGEYEGSSPKIYLGKNVAREAGGSQKIWAGDINKDTFLLCPRPIKLTYAKLDLKVTSLL